MNELGQNYNRIAVIAHFPRLSRAFNVWARLNRVTHDSWPALFNTKEHQRRKVRLEKAARRFNNLVEKEFNIPGQHWRVKLVPTCGPSILWYDDEQEA
jgi:hypothetical protein